MTKSKIILVTGASTGIGRGIAIALASAGHQVTITGRNQTTLDQVASDFKDQSGTGCAGKIVPKVCDHSDDKAVEKLFGEFEKLDVLINNAYSAVNVIAKVSKLSFWEIEPSVWDDVNNVGLRNHYRCSTFAARIMIKNKPEAGLIVNIGSAGGAMTLFNACYGIGKEGKDRMAVEMGREFRKKRENVYAMALWPGAVKTEKISAMYANPDGATLTSGGDPAKTDLNTQMFMDGESTTFSGLCLAEIVARMEDKKFMRSVNAKISWTCDLGKEFGLRDVDGRVIPSYIQMNVILKMAGWSKLSKFIPSFVKLPKFLFVSDAFGKRFR
jgi:dehydrogenase/reductase SDR family protein 1